MKHGASGKKGMLSCCKCLFERSGGNLAHIQAENLQNVQENVFFAKSSGSEWIKCRAKINGPTLAKWPQH